MDFRRILSDAGVSFIRMALGTVTGIITLPLITRLVGEGSYGIWTTILSFVGLVAMVGGLHLHGALIRYSKSKQDSTIFTDALALSVIAASVTLGLVLIGALGYDQIIGFESIPKGIILPAALLAAARILSNLLFNYSRAQHRVKRYEGMMMVRDIFKALTLLALLWWMQDIVIALWGIVSVEMIINIILLAVYYRHITSWPTLSNFKQLLEYGVPMVPKEAAGSLLHHADKFLLLFFIGPVSTGIYAAAYSIGAIFSNATGAFNSTLYPNTVSAWENEEFNELSRFYTNFLRWYTVLAVPAIVGLGLLAEPILRFLSTPTIATRGEHLVPILALAFAFQGLEFVLSFPLQAAERTKLLGAVTITAAALNLLLNFALIPSFGLIGAALATLIAFAARSSLLYQFTIDYLNISLPIQGFSYSVVASAVMVMILHMLHIKSWYWQLGFYPPIGAVCFATVFVAIGGLQDGELNLLHKKLWSKQRG